MYLASAPLAAEMYNLLSACSQQDTQAGGLEAALPTVDVRSKYWCGAHLAWLERQQGVERRLLQHSAFEPWSKWQVQRCRICCGLHVAGPLCHRQCLPQLLLSKSCVPTVVGQGYC